MICPNKNSLEWKALIDKHKNEKEAYREWYESNSFDNDSNIKLSEKEVFIKNKLQDKFDIDIVLNNNMGVSGRVNNTKDDIFIEINTKLLQEDTISHEYAHIFIDVIGGLENETVNSLYEQLKNTEEYAKIKEKYPDLNENQLAKELIATVLGKEVNDILTDNFEQKNNIAKFLRGIFNQLLDYFNFNKSELKNLANQMIKSEYKKEEIVLEELVYEQRSEDLTDNEKTKKEVIDVLKHNVNSKIKEFERYLDKKGESDSKSLDTLKNLLDDLETANADEALFNFAVIARKNTEQVVDRIKFLKEKEEDIKLTDLYKIKSYTDAFNNDITDLILETLDKEDSEIKKIIKEIQSNYKDIELEYHTLGTKALINTIKPQFNNVVAFYRRKAVSLFADYANKNNISKKDKNYEKEKLKFIDNFLKESASEIEEIQNEKSKKFLTRIDRDISVIDFWVTNPRDINNEIIQQAIEILDEADYETTFETEDILLKTKFYYDKYVEFVGKKNDQKEQYDTILNGEKGTYDGYLALPRTPKHNEIKKGKYKGTPVEEFYDHLVKITEIRDSYIPNAYKLGLKLPSFEKDNLERMYEAGPLAVLKGAIGDSFKLRKQDEDFGEHENNLKETGNYLDKKLNTLSDATGKEKQFIPILFRGELDVSEQSFDVPSLLTIDVTQSLNFKNKYNSLIKLTMMKDMLSRSSARVEQTGTMNKLKKVVSGTDIPITTEAKNSNVYKVLENLIETRVFNIKIKGDPKTAKTVQSIKSYVSKTLLINNYISGAANYLQGTAMNLIEAAGGDLFTVKDFITAKSKITKDFSNIAVDIANFKDTSKTNLLMRMLNVRSDFSVLDNKFSEDNALKRNLEVGSLIYSNRMAEYNIQANSMYASMNTMKVQNKQGEYINKKGEVVNKKDAMTVDEAFEVGYKNVKTDKTINEEEFNKLSLQKQSDYIKGDLKLNNNAFYADKIGEINQKNFMKLSKRLRDVNRSLYGNYDGNNRANIDRYAYGTILTHMRGWFVPLLKNRAKGLYTLMRFDKKEKLNFKFIKREDLRIDDLRYNENLDKFEEGFYVTTLRFLGEVLDDIRKLQFSLASTKWNKLDGYEKSNIRKTIMESGILALSIMVSSIAQAKLEDMDDDEEYKRAVLITSILANRLSNELMTFYNPMEWQRVMRSPAVSMGVLQNMTRGISYLISEPTAEFKRGKAKGENKAKVYLIKSTPFKSVYQDLENIHNFVTQ